MSIAIDHVTKRFGSFIALDDVSLAVREGQLTALLGPSGSGKTTLLRCIAGLDHPDRGSVRLGGVEAARIPLRDRRVGFVFQHYALFRHMTVAQNIAFGLTARPRSQRPPRSRIASRVRELLELVQLGFSAGRYPHQLSGGQRQRVALARALAIDPRVLLLDEPFGALDARVRAELRRWLRQFHEHSGVTTVFVTHDQEEAMEVADRVVVFNRGRLEQDGTPTEVYERPATPFVADFIGNAVRLPARIQGTSARIGPCTVLVPDQGPSERDAIAFVRPHQLRLSPIPGTGIPGVVVRLHAAGALTRIELQLPGLGLRCAVHLPSALNPALPTPGQEVDLVPLAAVVFPGEEETKTASERPGVASTGTEAHPAR